MNETNMFPTLGHKILDIGINQYLALSVISNEPIFGGNQHLFELAENPIFESVKRLHL